MMEKNKSFTEQYFKSFDSLKGLVILITVVIGHYWQFTPGEYWSAGENALLTGVSNWIMHLSFKTYSLMELLFMINGFQMWRHHEKIANGQLRFIPYVRRRVKRLFPMAMITTLIMAVGLMLYRNIVGEAWYGMNVNVRNIIENLLCIQSWFRMEHTLNGPLWYVSVYFACTLLFYILIRIAYLIFRNHKSGYWLVMVMPVLFGIYGTKDYIVKPLWNPDLCRGYMGFFMGVIIAMLAELMIESRKKLPTEVPGICCILFMTTYVVLDIKIEYIGISGSTPLSVMLTEMLLFGSILLLLSCYEMPNRILGNKVMAYLGKVSFHIYVWNFPFCLWSVILDKVFHIGIPFPMWYMVWLQAGLQICIGVLSHRYIENKHINALQI